MVKSGFYAVDFLSSFKIISLLLNGKTICFLQIKYLNNPFDAVRKVTHERIGEDNKPPVCSLMASCYSVT